MAKNKGLWANIRAKRKRGEAPAKKGDKNYPETLDIGEGSMETARKNVGADKCWDGYKAKGTKKKDGKTVPNCVKEDKSFSQFCTEACDKPPERLKTDRDMFNISKKDQKSAKERLLAKAKAKREEAAKKVEESVTTIEDANGKVAAEIVDIIGPADLKMTGWRQQVLESLAAKKEDGVVSVDEALPLLPAAAAAGKMLLKGMVGAAGRKALAGAAARGVAASIKGSKDEKKKKDVKEVLDMNTADMGDVIKDFRKSKAPQFKGKSEKERQKMAIAAKLSTNEEKDWIQGAIKKPGALHRELDVPEGKKIPAKKLNAAAKKGGKLGQRARLAKTLNKIKEEAAWTRKEGQNPEGGLNKKGRESAKADGHTLKAPVTKKPSELKKGGKAANRRKSFCARMGGMKKRLTSAKTANDPDSRINKALRKWNC